MTNDEIRMKKKKLSIRVILGATRGWVVWLVYSLACDL
jgi:hypothetical protein